jgi:predicted nucleic acid-binding protein
MLKSLGRTHSFIPDDQRGTILPAWCKAAARTADAYLLALANAHGAKLATLDTGIPGAFALPS